MWFDFGSRCLIKVELIGSLSYPMHITHSCLFSLALSIFCLLSLYHHEPDGAGRGGDGEDQELPVEAESGGDSEARADPDTLHQLDQGESLGAVLGVLAAYQRDHLEMEKCTFCLV